MKNLKFVGILLLVIIALQACNSGSYKAAKIENRTDSVSYLIGLSIGRDLKMQEIPDIDPSLIAKGINAAFENDSTISPMVVREYLTSYMKEIYEKKSAKSKEEGVAFLEANKKKDGVMVTASGLQYKVITEGTGRTPSGNDRVKCHYKGTLTSGEKFDSSYDRGEPAEFSLQGMIPGFTEGLQLMKEGGKYELFIPSELAYGPQGAGQKIGPNSVLVFEVELLEVIPQTGNEKGSN